MAWPHTTVAAIKAPWGHGPLVRLLPTPNLAKIPLKAPTLGEISGWAVGISAQSKPVTIIIIPLNPALSKRPPPQLPPAHPPLYLFVSSVPRRHAEISGGECALLTGGQNSGHCTHTQPAAGICLAIISPAASVRRVRTVVLIVQRYPDPAGTRPTSPPTMWGLLRAPLSPQVRLACNCS
jgi:hypothetical protein